MKFCIFNYYIFSPGPLWISASLLNGPPWKNKVYLTLLYYKETKKYAYGVRGSVMAVSLKFQNFILEHALLIAALLRLFTLTENKVSLSSRSSF